LDRKSHFSVKSFDAPALDLFKDERKATHNTIKGRHALHTLEPSVCFLSLQIKKRPMRFLNTAWFTL